MNRVGTWNVRAINGDEKRREVMDAFINGKLDIFALIEAKKKGTLREMCVCWNRKE